VFLLDGIEKEIPCAYPGSGAGSCPTITAFVLSNGLNSNALNTLCSGGSKVAVFESASVKPFEISAMADFVLASLKKSSHPAGMFPSVYR